MNSGSWPAATRKPYIISCFGASSEALQELAADPKFIGGRLGMVGVLHTWTRALLYHPHAHHIVTGAGLSDDGHWRPARSDFLVPVKALSIIFRAKFRYRLKKTPLFPLADQRVWKKDWVVHCEPVGSGQEAFRYLAPYIFRVAISNNRILKLEDGHVTFQYKDSATDHIKFKTVRVEEFIRRFLHHVLPDRFIKVRYDGLLTPCNRHLLNQAKEALGPTPIPTDTAQRPGLKPATEAPHCPTCGSLLLFVQKLRPKGREPP